jgi:hypothetical protein
MDLEKTILGCNNAASSVYFVIGSLDDTAISELVLDLLLKASQKIESARELLETSRG